MTGSIMLARRPHYAGAHTIVAARSSSLRAAGRGATETPRALFAGFQGLGKAGSKRKQEKKLVDALVEAASGTDRGLTTTPEQEQEIEGIVAELEALGEDQITTDDSLSATWKLLWTTEKETLFIVEKAGLFGTEAGDVFQVIDVAEGTLQNVITFPPEGAFIVSSTVAPDGPQRMNFKFNSAKLKTPRTDIPFPPIGQGWFESIYLNDRIRVAKDIRGDTLVVVRDGPPQVFE